MFKTNIEKEKIYLSVLLIGIIILIFVIIYLRNNCPQCKQTYSPKPEQPVVIYKIGD